MVIVFFIILFLILSIYLYSLYLNIKYKRQEYNKLQKVLKSSERLKIDINKIKIFEQKVRKPKLQFFRLIYKFETDYFERSGSFARVSLGNKKYKSQDFEMDPISLEFILSNNKYIEVVILDDSSCFIFL